MEYGQISINNSRAYLRAKWEERIRRNPAYSMRALARDLGLSVSTVSELLSKKIGLSATAAEKIIHNLNLDMLEREHLLDIAAAETSKSKKIREAANIKLRVREIKNTKTVLTVDAFKVVADWYHLAILEISELNNFESDSKWIARKLGIDPVLVENAIERLMRLGIIEKQENGWRVTEDFSSISSQAPSEGIRNFHRQVLNLAIDSISTQKVSERELGSLILACRSSDLPEMRKELQNFRRKFTAKFGRRENKDSVYCLATPLFSLMPKDIHYKFFKTGESHDV